MISVMIDCTAPKLILTSQAMLSRSRPLSNITWVCTTLTFSSAMASLGQCEKHAVMIGCICKARLRNECATHFSKMENLEIRAVIKYFCTNAMPPREIHEYFMKTLRKECFFLQQSLRGGERER